MKTACILGASGLAGSSIYRKLLASTEYTNVLTPSSKILDLREQKTVRSYFNNYNIDHVYLAAATVGGIMSNKTRKAEFIYDNLMIQTNVIDSAYRSGVGKLLFLGTSCIYPAGRQHPLKEEELLTGPLEPTNDAYAIAKIAGIKQCDFYREQYGFDAFSLMPPNLYGPGDNYTNGGHVLAALIERFHKAKIDKIDYVECWGDGTPMREFLYVEDLADACFYFMKNYFDGGHINVGTNTDITIKELAETVAKVVGYKGKIGWDITKPNGNPRKLLDSTRANELGWKANTKLNDGIQTTYKEYLTHV